MTETTPDYAGLSRHLGALAYHIQQTGTADGQDAQTCLEVAEAIRALLERIAALERERTNLIETKREQIDRLNTRIAELEKALERDLFKELYAKECHARLVERDRLAERVAALEREREELKHDLERYISIASEEATRAEAAEARLAEARRLIRSTHKRAVTHTNCEDEFCAICVGGLFICADCGAVEAEAEERICTGGKEHP